ncbi:aldehyde dehydrogenase family protein [Corynebacterium sp. 320]|uniref:L-glutamate gamma-semialdehyde dehydrogenase n=1 Tax=Corynebacterium zhongnanshanii TaxID=2768834 RepID=A0ABQ6VDN5_9CORY|nr:MULTISPECIES: bifunctional proline dehydrogenase/L-glutamate gamma-semialdehyde dehydrogenase [Corynebacterium]KAB1501403.1 aldehyde dehydrogenase family protein [Corynebacterium sp. 320]KAB3521015.1 aldehyde dehydrogenase family protein [Corynebacterium zhongnanshanii]KAB3525761.1 aldehyde dehydrogenase family protein [Corynebacterium sp. 250]MCR5914656.1 aldehyde dehydrogenase family protein [Corynebacterium sp. zg254]QNP92648.1 bifunctional proline dehydrogenase/L-glutamate gamma-semiald
MSSPANTPLPNSGDVEAVVDAAISRANEWLQIEETSASTQQLADLVHDPDGVEFTFAFVDRVARPEDNRVAAKEFVKIAHPFKKSAPIPDFMGPIDSLLVTAGSIFAPLLPSVVMPIARSYLRSTVAHLVLDAESKALDELLDRSREEGFRLNLNLLGEAVLGEEEATRRRDDIINLLKNPRVDYVSVKASSVVSQLNHWDHDGSIERLKDRLRPLYRQAMTRNPHPFINLDMEEYKDLDLTIHLFTELLSEEEFHDLEAGIVLQGYLPDTFYALQTLAEFARKRREAGGAKIKVRLVKGANLSMENVDAEIHDWPLAPYPTKPEVDANYVRLLDYILQPEHADNIRIGVASHNLFHLGLAIELANKRGVKDQLDIEMLQGMAPGQSKAIRELVGDLILYTPVVKKEDFDVAISYLVRRLEENGAKQNFLYALFAPGDDEGAGFSPMDGQKQAFLNSVQDRWTTVAGPYRTQNRLEESKQRAGTRSGGIAGHFINEPDTDPVLPANREWALQLIDPSNDPGPAVSELVTDTAVIDAAVDRSRRAAEAWGSKSGAERAELLDRAADALADNRGRLISAAVFEAGKTIAETDPEVSEAIDFARYYAESARQLDLVRGSVFTPYKTVVVTPPWNFPIAIPLGGVFASLAAGATVIIKPAPQVLRIAEIFMEILRDAGVTEDLVQLVNADEADAGKHLVSHPDVDSVILTGASETAALFRSWKPRLTINAETSGKNAIIVTPSADPDLAVADVFKSAYGHAGQKCSAASLIITVGSLGKSERFRNQLVDAVRTIKVGHGTDISTNMNGVIEAPGDKLLRGLTQLEPGEKWLVKPQKLNEEGTLWTPGLRDNVKPGSWFHTHECFGPVAGIMHASTLDEAIEWQNSTGFGLTGGIHTLDDNEKDYWRERVEVGNAYIQRGITGAIVQRQSFGGWKNSSIGSGAKAGGPNYVAQQGIWSEGDLAELPTGTIDARITQLLRTFHAAIPVNDQDNALSGADHEWLRTAAESDAFNWATEFGIEHDKTGLTVESNIFRYRSLLEPLRVRVNEHTNARDLLRLVLASYITGTALDISANEINAENFAGLSLALHEAANAAPAKVTEAYGDSAVNGYLIRVTSDKQFAQEIENASCARIRSLGETPEEFYVAAAKSGAVILDQDVLADGRRELLPLLLEQAVSETKHRFGFIQKH